MTAREAYLFVQNDLKNACVAEPEAKAREIVAHALDIDYADIFFYQHVDAPGMERIRAMTKRCAAGEPVQYVTGMAYFRHLQLRVTPDVLIPRKETELIAEKAIDLISRQRCASVLDMCTGSGCIAISLATETQAEVEACDISEKALELASDNAIAHHAAIRFFSSDLFRSVDRTYDLIVSNPPYVSEEEYETLAQDVRLFEPRLALLAEDGLSFYRRIACKAADCLKEDGMLVLEIGANQASEVTVLLGSSFDNITCFKDYEGRDRIVTARKKQGVQCLRNSMNIKKGSIS